MKTNRNFKKFKKRKPNLNNRIRKLESAVKKAVNYKYNESEISQGVSSAGTITWISQCIEGTGEQDRDGLDIYPVSIEFKVAMLLGDSTNLMRLIIFKERGSPVDIGNYPTLQSIIDVASVTSSNPVVALRTYENKSKYKVLFDKTYSLATNWQPVQFDKHYMKLKPKDKTTYLNAGTGTTDRGQNHYYILAVSDSGAVAHPTMELNVRFYFTD